MPRLLASTIPMLATAAVALTALPASAQNFRGSTYGPGSTVSDSPFPGYRWANPTMYSTGANYFGGPAVSYGPAFPYAPAVPGFPLPQPACVGCPSGGLYAGSMGHPSGAVVVPSVEMLALDGTSATSGYGPGGGEIGMRVVEVLAGPAREAGLPAGAVIVGVDDQRTRSLDQLQAALRAGKGTVKVTAVGPDGRRTTRDVAVLDNRIGVTVVPGAAALPADTNRTAAGDRIDPSRAKPEAPKVGE